MQHTPQILCNTIPLLTQHHDHAQVSPKQSSPYIHPSIHLSIHLSIHTCIHTSIHPYIHPSMELRIVKWSLLLYSYTMQLSVHMKSLFFFKCPFVAYEDIFWERKTKNVHIYQLPRLFGFWTKILSTRMPLLVNFSIEQT